MHAAAVLELLRIEFEGRVYGHGNMVLYMFAPKGKRRDDHDQDFLKTDLLQIWSWSSDIVIVSQGRVCVCMSPSALDGFVMQDGR